MKANITELLRQHLADCQAQNPAYSLRALARDLAISSASLSLTIAGKRQLSRKNLEKVAARLGLSPLDVERLRWDAPFVSDDQVRPRILKDDEFRLVADWYYYAILNLAKIAAAKADTSWIAKRLGISEIVAGTALDRLQRLELLEVQGTKLVRTSRSLNTENDIPSSAIRNHHRQNLKRAETALESVDVESREFACQTAAINSKNLPKAKAAIRRFKEELMDLLEEGKANEVYTLGIQLFPVVSDLDSKRGKK